MIDRRGFLKGSGSLLAGAAVASSSLGAWAVEQRNALQQLVYGYPPGGAGDQLAIGALALLAGQGTRYELAHIEGLNTRAASVAVKGAPPDGNTLLQVLSSSLTLIPQIYRKPGFDPVADFQPLANMGDFTLSLAVGPLVPKSVTNLEQFLKWVGDNPESRNIGFAIYGSLPHLATRVLARESGLALRGQSYKGTTAMLDDVRKGSLAAAFTVAGNGIGTDTSSPLRAIGVTSKQRLSYWPGIASLYEQGIEQMDISGWFGWFAPAATPETRAAPLRGVLERLQASPDYRALQRRLLFTHTPQTPEQIRQRMRDEIDRFAKLLDSYQISKID